MHFYSFLTSNARMIHYSVSEKLECHMEHYQQFFLLFQIVFPTILDYDKKWWVMVGKMKA